MSSLIPSSPEAHASYALYGELDVLLDITKTVLDRTHHAHRFSFGREARDTLESFSVHERARLANSGRLYLHLGVATLFRQRVSSVVEQVILEAIITETIHIFTTSQNRHPTLCVQLGMMAVLQGYDEIYRLLKSALCHDLLAKIALATRHFPERVGAPVVPADRLHKILIRLRDHTNGQIVGPEQLSDLRPVRAPGTPPSNRLLSEACPFRSLLLAHPQRAAFLQAVVRAEILSDGTPLFLLPPMEVSAWNTVLESTEKRRMQLSLCEPVIKTFVSEVVLENMDFDSFDETEYKTILHVVTSDLTLLYLLFRMGVYQEIPECPFDGMTASYPATALRFYFSALHRTSHERNDEVTTAVLGCFGNLVKVVSEASAFFTTAESVPTSTPGVPSGVQSSPQRKVLADTQVGVTFAATLTSKDKAATTGSHSHRHLGRTVVPIIHCARKPRPIEAASHSLLGQATTHSL
ncbi:hypothetical protein DFH06DRAFT_1309795 [Mycena polygramma]|nr:hypothetical protein DFH06DRAFT_1309795 [Mycena polygramma]